MRIAVAQLDPVVGAFEENVKKIKEAYQRACAEKARVLITPELGVCGYPPHDLIDRPEMFERNEKAVAELLSVTKSKNCALIVGYVERNASSVGRAAQNAIKVLDNGKEVFQQAKTLLPTYDVFDEARYFEPAQSVSTWNCDGRKIAIAVCEDLWASDPKLGRRLYGKNPVDTYRRNGVSLILSVSASPYEWGKRQRRELIHMSVAKDLKAPLVYVNQVGATDEILFDGGSFALDCMGQVKGQLPIFSTGFAVLDVDVNGDGGIIWKTISPTPSDKREKITEIGALSKGLVVGVMEYFARTKFSKAIIGLSGGIDSSVVAVLAQQALGASNVLGVAMPSQYSSPDSLRDAEKLAKNLGIRFGVKPIKFLFSQASREIAEGHGGLSEISLENLQSRLRGIILMTLANNYSALVLTTGNKSELATGYCTLYGDMVGALAPIGDVLKTRVYELARFLNSEFDSPIPENCLVRPPTAELKPGQTDQDTLPPYDKLDELLYEYVEHGASVAALEERFVCAGESESWVRAVLRRLEMNEYKRRQAAPVLKISSKAFGIGRRIPIAKTWDQQTLYL
ncbi:MAG: NAD+ synthase [Bdellovibrionota bacterium]